MDSRALHNVTVVMAYTLFPGCRSCPGMMESYGAAIIRGPGLLSLVIDRRFRQSGECLQAVDDGATVEAVDVGFALLESATHVETVCCLAGWAGGEVN